MSYTIIALTVGSTALSLSAFMQNPDMLTGWIAAGCAAVGLTIAVTADTIKAIKSKRGRRAERTEILTAIQSLRTGILQDITGITNQPCSHADNLPGGIGELRQMVTSGGLTLGALDERVTALVQRTAAFEAAHNTETRTTSNQVAVLYELLTNAGTINHKYLQTCAENEELKNKIAQFSGEVNDLKMQLRSIRLSGHLKEFHAVEEAG